MEGLELEPLAETMPLLKYETAGSLLSRNAAMNLAGNAREFSGDFYLNFRKISAGDPAELARLATLLSADLRELARWSPRRVGRGSFSIAGETVTHTRSRRRRLRVCPACVDEQLAAAPGVLGDAAVATLAFSLVEPIRTCPIHARSLVQIADASTFGDHEQDYAIAVAEALEDDEWRGRSVERPVSGFESYLLGRIGIGERIKVELLDDLGISEVMTVCERIGCFLTQGRSAQVMGLDEDARHAVAQGGFEVMEAGEKGVRSFVDLAHDRAIGDGRNGMPSTIFGRFRLFLNAEARSPVYQRIKQIVVDRLSEILPYGPDDPPLFGVLPQKRHWHTLISAERQYGMPYRTIKNMVLRAGVGSRLNAAVKKTRFLIPAAELDQLLASPDKLISRAETTLRTGAKIPDLVAMEVAGLLSPQKGSASDRRAMFRLGDVDRAMARLVANAEAADEEREGWVSLHRAFIFSNWTRDEVLDLIVTGKVTPMALTGSCLFSTIRVEIDALNRLHPLNGIEAISQEDAADLLGVGDTVISRLVEKGVLTKHYARNRRKQLKSQLLKTEVLEFRDTFIPASEVWKRTALGMSKINTLLQSAALAPAFPPSEMRASIYRREDVYRVLPALDRPYVKERTRRVHKRSPQ